MTSVTKMYLGFLVATVAAVSPSLADPSAKPAKPVKELAWADEPAWPEAGELVKLAWVIGPDRKNPHGDLPLHPVELVAKIGAVERHIPLKPEIGNLRSYNQVICNPGAYPFGKHDVAVIIFYEGGASGYLVKRVGSDVLEIHGWAGSDGACTSPSGKMIACPVDDELVARFHVPADAKITGGTIYTTEKGKIQKMLCEPQE